MPEDLLHPSGVYNPGLRFAFTNITQEDFTSYWGGQPITVKAGRTVELPHHLAVKMTREIVDKILVGEAKLDEVTYYKNNPGASPNSYRSPKGMAIGVPEQRKPFEEKVCRVMAPDEEDPQWAIKRAEMREELMADMNREASRSPVSVPATVEPGKLPGEFAELGKEQPKQEKPPLKVKEVK